MDWHEGGGTRWLEAGLPGARAIFSTRLGGVSEGPYSTLNLGILTGDERERVISNRIRLSAATGIDPERVVLARQVHGAGLIAHDGPQDAGYWPDPRTEPPHADGHIVDRTGPAALVFVADCLPIALAGPAGLAVLHCGWRGLAAGIVGAGIAATGANAAAIGPGIGRCCYEVGDEVLAAFAPLGPGLADGRRLDLAAVARRLLERAGVEEIETAAICTRCEPETFFSHRGEGPETGRQAGIVVGTDG
jgi:YfiH family protein